MSSCVLLYIDARLRANIPYALLCLDARLRVLTPSALRYTSMLGCELEAYRQTESSRQPIPEDVYFIA